MKLIYVVRTSYDGVISASTSLKRTLEDCEREVRLNSDNPNALTEDVTYYHDGGDLVYNRAAVMKCVRETGSVTLYIDGQCETIEIRSFDD